MENEQNSGVTLDKLLSCLGGLEKRLSSMEKASADYDKRTRADARKRARADAEAAKGKDAPAPPPMLNDPDDPDRRCGDPRQTAADNNEGKDMNDLPEKIRRAKEMRDALNQLEREVTSEMRETARGPLYEAEQEQIADCQARADSAYSELGRRAPPPMPGERLPQYRRRLLQPLKSHSPTWKDVNLADHSGPNLDVIEKQVYADAIAYADSAENFSGDEIQAIQKRDDSGRMITTFKGRHSFVRQFKPVAYRANIRDPREIRLREILSKSDV
jgi:hypothetical protein